MLYDYLRDIDKCIIKPTEKQHKAMLFLLSPEVSTLLHSPIIKQKQLAYELRVSESFLSTNKTAFSIQVDLADITSVWSDQWDYIETTDKSLISYVTTDKSLISYVTTDNTLLRQANLIIDGVPLYHRDTGGQ